MRGSKRSVWPALLGVPLVAVSCGGDSVGPRLTEVMERIELSSGGDKDADGLPDEVEAWLGTNPADRDSDRDGMPDYYEVFGTGEFNADDRVLDRDGDGKFAPVDQDDDGDGKNDGEQVDSDGDGVPNYLEMYGYVHSAMTGKYRLWDGKSDGVRYFKSDPYQKWTDQDPYDDAVEASGVGMDVSVRDPGTLPMVPAYPEISVTLMGYEVTLNEQITYSSGGSLQSGTTWSRSTETTNSQTSETSWEVGATGEISETPKLSISVNHGWKDSVTDSTTDAEATGGSLLSTSDWSRATSANPTDAARIKLYLKVRNRGTAAASNVVPTLTLRIGGHSIATFEPGNAQINLIEPNGVYPAADGVYWVVDTYDTGVGVSPLSLTLTELQALETGTPVSLTLTQMAAEVVQLDPATGKYESHGDWNEYMARIKSVSAFFFADLGGGNLIRSYVYAGDGPTAPVVTLADAVAWTAGARRDEQGQLVVKYWDQKEGTNKEAVIEGEGQPLWSLAFDRQTYERNGYLWDEAAGKWKMPAEKAGVPADPWQMRLFPGTVVTAKAPAEVGIPLIHFALFDPASGAVVVSAEDYSGVDKVEFVDQSGTARAMKPDVAGSNIYILFLEDTGAGQKSSLAGGEKVRVTNVKGVTAEAPLTEVYRPEFIHPEISKVHLDLTDKKLTADVSWEGGSLAAPPAWVRVFHPGFEACSPDAKSYMEMSQTDDLYKNPDGWKLYLPSDWTATDLKIVAYTGEQGLYTEYAVTAADLDEPYAAGTQTLFALGGGKVLYVYTHDFEVISGLDADKNPPKSCMPGSCGSWTLGEPCSLAKVNDSGWAPNDPGIDFWIRYETGKDDPWRFALYFGSGVTFKQITDSTFASLTLSHLQAANPTQKGRFPADPSNFFGTDPAVFAIKTSEGRYAKLELTNLSSTQGKLASSSTSCAETYSQREYQAKYLTYANQTPTPTP